MEFFEKSGSFIKGFAKVLFVILAVLYFIAFVYLLSEDMAGEGFLILIFGGIFTALMCFSLYITGDTYELNKQMVALLHKNNNQNELVVKRLEAIYAVNKQNANNGQ